MSQIIEYKGKVYDLSVTVDIYSYLCQSTGLCSSDLSLIETLYKTGKEAIELRDELREELRVARSLLNIVADSHDAVKMGTPLYRLNPTWQTMNCVDAAIVGGCSKLIKTKMEYNQLPLLEK